MKLRVKGNVFKHKVGDIIEVDEKSAKKLLETGACEPIDAAPLQEAQEGEVVKRKRGRPPKAAPAPNEADE